MTTQIAVPGKIKSSTLNLKNFKSLLPAAECVICGQTLDQIGGRRITSQKLRGMAIWHEEWTLHNRANLQYCERLVDDQDIYLIIWWDDNFWNPKFIEKIKNTYLSGVRPWMCQGYGCGNRQCPECGKAINLPVASDLLYDDGRNPYLMIIPADCGCVNKDCKKFRDFDDDWEIVKAHKP